MDSLASPKVRYVRSDDPLAMSENWELAVSHADGEYVLVIGDDDGLLLHALQYLDRLLQARPVKVLRWERVSYQWPDTRLMPYSDNMLHLPLVCRDQWMWGREVILMAAKRGAQTRLPMLYNSAIHKDLLAELRQRTGRVFGAAAPDVYSGFAFAYLAGSYLSCGVPITISGGSRHSTGMVHNMPKEPIYQEAASLNEKFGFRQHPKVPDVPAISAMIADAFQWAKDALFPGDPILRLFRRRLAMNCMEQVCPENAEEWRTYLEAICRSLADRPVLQKCFAGKHLNTPFNPKPPRLSVVVAEGYHGFSSGLTVDASKFGVADVFGAAELCEKIACYSTAESGLMRGFIGNLPVRARTVVGTAVRGDLPMHRRRRG